VIEADEALDQEDPIDQHAGLLKCGLKWVGKVLPVDYITEAATQAIDKVVDIRHWTNNRLENGMGTMGSSSQWSQVGR
jgi:hypothetical protein